MQDGHRLARRQILCAQAFQRLGVQNVDRTKLTEGLRYVFEQLGDIPVPKDAWYGRVFENFCDAQGMVDSKSFLEIVNQWDDHQMKKKLSKASGYSTDTAPISTSTEGATGAITPGNKTPSTASTKRAMAANVVADVMFPKHNAKLTNYDHVADLGQGTFGKVLAVLHKSTGQTRACKMIIANSVKWRDLTNMEIELLRGLHHPNVMKMYEVYIEQHEKHGSIYWIVSELCQGGDLGTRIAHHRSIKQQMPETYVAYIMRQMLAGTNYCHCKGVVHRDIKPENILFSNRTSGAPLKIIDFGLASFMDCIPTRDDGTGSGNVKMQTVGTPHYLAPEMIQGRYDQKADLFSIGIIYAELLTGVHPFWKKGDSEVAVLQRIQQTAIFSKSGVPLDSYSSFWEHVSVEACDFCQKLLEKDPQFRLSAAEALNHVWFQDPEKPNPFGNVEGLTGSIFYGLQQYQEFNKLKRAVLQLLTHELSEYEIQELSEKFKALDNNGDGFLLREELLRGMVHAGHVISGDELDRIIAALDTSGSGRIGYKDFIAALIQRRVKFDRRQLQECFNKFDTTGTGKITYKDVERVLCPTITRSEWQSIVGGVPEKSEIDFAEFVALMETPDRPES
eukprot:TRINITY_DN91788_c0_g1_i1.p1 TRINITY_DN91788_c0_g1~~TRINITY_DN91788_c0_g1_i1.p1  ORF type:complete len:619 (+),score=83.86 TRINITY_DN91788_c0_g1_i1:45-1901(+)